MRLLEVRYCLVVTLCVLGSVFCAAQEPVVSNEVSYLSFALPGALGTYPMSINASMVVTGYYYVSPTMTRGFLRDADGAITTFDVMGGIWTEPESINAAGDIAGFYEVVPGVPHGFMRYADGRIVNFDPPDSLTFFGPLAQTVTINDFREIAGSYGVDVPEGFTRSPAGAFTALIFAQGALYGTVVTDLNASGTVVGYYSVDGNIASLISNPDGFSTSFVLPIEAGDNDGTWATVAESLNADGVIAGEYSVCSYPCATTHAGGFVRSPQGVFTLFNPPGPIVTSLVPHQVLGGVPLTTPHRLSINQAGTITGSYIDAEGAQHGFTRNPYGTITSFDPPRGKQTTATSINDSGLIAGYYFYDWNTQIAQGFLRLPKP
jgi:hypothetical protein